MKQLIQNIKQLLSRLSFRTGVIVLLCCIPCYILSFAQMLLPIGTSAKGILWFILFGLAKTLAFPNGRRAKPSNTEVSPFLVLKV